MRDNISTNIQPPRRGRPRKVEPYAAWLARIDAEVERMTRTAMKHPPTWESLHPAQRKLVEMLIEHLRSLPRLKPGEDCLKKPEFRCANQILTSLLATKYPEWTKLTTSGARDIDSIPGCDGDTIYWILRNCGGQAPAGPTEGAEEEDDD